MHEFWQPWNGPSGTTGPNFLGVTGAVTGPAFYGFTGQTGPAVGAVQEQPSKIKYLYDRARIELVGASDTMIRAMMYDTMQEFFNDSSIWLEVIPGLLYPGVRFYYLEPGNVQSLGDAFPHGTIIRLAGVKMTNLYFNVPASMQQPPILELQHTQSNEVSVWTAVIKNVSIPHNDELVRFPHWIVDSYERYILAGIKGRLQLQSDRPYSDPKMGAINYQQFRQGVNMARVAALRRNTYGGQAWAYPQQFRTQSQYGWAVSTGNSRLF